MELGIVVVVEEVVGGLVEGRKRLVNMFLFLGLEGECEGMGMG